MCFVFVLCVLFSLCAPRDSHSRNKHTHTKKPTKKMGEGADKKPPPPEALKAINLCADSADLIVGQKVYAIGNPFG